MNIAKKIFALVLSLVLSFSAVSFDAYAADSETSAETLSFKTEFYKQNDLGEWVKVTTANPGDQVKACLYIGTTYYVNSFNVIAFYDENVFEDSYALDTAYVTTADPYYSDQVPVGSPSETPADIIEFQDLTLTRLSDTNRVLAGSKYTKGLISEGYITQDYVDNHNAFVVKGSIKNNRNYKLNSEYWIVSFDLTVKNDASGTGSFEVVESTIQSPERSKSYSNIPYAPTANTPVEETTPLYACNFNVEISNGFVTVGGDSSSTDEYYTVTYYKDNDKTEIFTSQTGEADGYAHGDALRYPDSEPNAPEGMYFAGWSVPEGTEVTGDVDIIPVFEKIPVSVFFEDYYGDPLDGFEIDLTYGDTVSVSDLPDASDLQIIEGYEFKYWMLDNIEVSEDFVIKDDIVLVPHYEAREISLIFDANGGEFAEGAKTVEKTVKYETELTSDILPEEPVRPGYKFDYWADFDEGALVENFDGMTFNAEWKANTDTAYKIEVYTENLDADKPQLGEYSLLKTINGNGKTDTFIPYGKDEISGFTMKEYDDILITGDGMAVLKVYYLRNKLTLTINGVQTEFAYGAMLDKPADPDNLADDQFVTGWTVNGVEVKNWPIPIEDGMVIEPVISTLPSTQPTVTEPSTIKPEASEPSTKPDVTVPTTTQPATTVPSTTKPVVSEPSTTKPAVTEPQPTKPSVTEPEKEPTTDAVVNGFKINTPSKYSINCADSIKLHVSADVSLDGYTVVWSADNAYFDMLPSETDNTCVITSSAKGVTVITATLLDDEGNEIASDSVEMKSNAGFFQKILAFFKKLFSLTKFYEK